MNTVILKIQFVFIVTSDSVIAYFGNMIVKERTFVLEDEYIFWAPRV